MENPLFGTELLAIAPDGSLAGFAVVWIDERTATGLFEPVGVHPDHQRRGLGKLYRSGGFTPTWALINFTYPKASA